MRIGAAHVGAVGADESPGEETDHKSCEKDLLAADSSSSSPNVVVCCLLLSVIKLKNA